MKISLLASLSALCLSGMAQAGWYSDVNFKLENPEILEISHTQTFLHCKNHRPIHLLIRKRLRQAGIYRVKIHRSYGNKNCIIKTVVEVKKDYWDPKEAMKPSIKAPIEVKLSNTSLEEGYFKCSLRRDLRDLNCEGKYTAFIDGDYDNHIPIFLD